MRVAVLRSSLFAQKGQAEADPMLTPLKPFVEFQGLVSHVTEAWLKSEKAIIRDGKIVEYLVNLHVTFILKH